MPCLFPSASNVFVLIILREQRRPCSVRSIVRDDDDDDDGGDDEVQLSLGQSMAEEGVGRGKKALFEDTLRKNTMHARDLT
ncbi:hypothetical protein M9458_021091, partial [Cirrhinus mrigala]